MAEEAKLPGREKENESDGDSESKTGSTKKDGDDGGEVACKQRESMQPKPEASSSSESEESSEGSSDEDTASDEESDGPATTISSDKPATANPPAPSSAPAGPAPRNRKARRALLAEQREMQQGAPPSKRQRCDGATEDVLQLEASALKRTVPDTTSETAEPANRKQRRALARGESVTAATPSASPAASPTAALKSDYDWNTLANQAIAATPNKMLKVKQLRSRILGKIVAASNTSGQQKQGLGQLVKEAIPGDLSLDSSAGFVITGNEVRH